MAERDVVGYLMDRVRDSGGEVRKCRWIGRNGAPDLRVLLPGRAFWVEAKAGKKGPTPAQSREHTRMRAAGEIVWVIDSFEKVDEVLR